MTLYRVYPDEAAGTLALDHVNYNMRHHAMATGYEVLDGVILGKTEGETVLDAAGTSTWAELAEVGPGQWGFVDPVTIRPDMGPFLMDGVAPGVLVDIPPPPDEGNE